MTTDASADLKHALSFIDAKQPDKAADLCVSLREIHPDDFDVWHLSGIAAALLGDHAGAKTFFERALTLQDDVPAVYLNLARSLTALTDPDGVAQVLTRGLSKILDNQDLLRAQLAHARAVADVSLEQQTLAALHRIVPNDAQILTDLAWVDLSLGRTSGVEQKLAQAIALDPSSADTLYKFSMVHRFSEDDPHLKTIQNAMTADTTSDEDKARLGFALGKAYDSLGQWEEAAACFDDANRRKTHVKPFDRRRFDEQIAALRRGHARIKTANPTPVPMPETTPIFIVGLPRSGTTIVEQILAQHSAVLAGGERLSLKHIVRDACSKLGLAFPDDVAVLSDDVRRLVAKAYIKDMIGRAPPMPYVTDKLPANFMNIGIIRFLFPNARIVHCVRDLRDSCLSIYQNYFAGNLPYAYDQTDLGHYANAYRSLMTYWHEELPGDLFDLRYETLVRDFEPTVRALLDYCGLPFESVCLEFQSAKNVVRTVSVAAVRQPLSDKAIGKWRVYEPHIQPLLGSLSQGDET